MKLFQAIVNGYPRLEKLKTSRLTRKKKPYKLIVGRSRAPSTEPLPEKKSLATEVSSTP